MKKRSFLSTIIGGRVVEMDCLSVLSVVAAFFMFCHAVYFIAVAFFNAPVESFFVICCLVLLVMAFCTLGYETWSWISKKRRDRDVKQ